VKRLFKNIVAKKEISETLEQIQNAGGQATYVQGDVTKLASILPHIQQATQQLGAISGIIHGAGRLADKFIQDKTAEDFNNVLSVKLDGLLSLLQCVDLQQLKHLILFSSVAGFYGNRGQTDYAIANEVLSKAAHLFKSNHPDTQVSAINWGAWDAGMVSPELKKKFAEAGVTLVDSEGGAAMLVNELSTEFATQPQCIIGGTLPAAAGAVSNDIREYRILRKLTLKENPFLHHHVIQGQAVLPVVNAVGWMAQTCERLYPGFRIHEVADTKLFKGLVFDGNEKENYYTEIEEMSKGPNEIQFVCTVLSEGAKLPTYHYKASVTLRRNGTIESPARFQHELSGSFEARSGAYLYEDGSLFHGPYFQGIDRILDWNEQQIVLACRAPEVPLAEQGQFPISSVNTFFCDIQYQAMVIWVQRYNDGAKSLPLATDSAIIYKDIPFGKALLVHVEVLENTAFKMVANCTVYDESGEVYMVTRGAAVTVSQELKW
ncbi:MAG: SDR family NAD(P)-dependent oxidoreductase, partial [Bacteroidota bacterium]